MAEPGSVPSPFDLPPRRTEARSGCNKAVLLGCGGLLVLFGILAVVFVAKAPDILKWGLGYTEREVMGRLPEEVTAAERDRLQRAFAGAGRGIEAQPDPEALQAFQSKMLQISGKPKLTPEDVRELTEVLERLGGAPKPP
jgi:hypothetical protein